MKKITTLFGIMTMSFMLNAQFAMNQQLVQETAEQNFNPMHADFDSDGDEDVLVKQDGYIQVHENNSGSFSIYNIDISDADFGYWYDEPIVSDLDNDGDQDIIVENRWLENVNGDFNTVHFYLDPLIEDFYVNCADVNNDGSQDLVLYRVFETYPTGPNYSLINDGTGNFTSYEIPSFGLAYHRMELHDMNADGFLDMIYMANLGQYSIWSCYNDGSGQFLAPVQLTPAYDIANWHFADMNGDSWTDIILVGNEDHNMRIYFNSGTGDLLQLQEYYLVTNFRYHVSAQANVVNDYDGDGDNDLMLTIDSDVHWLENTSTGFEDHGVILTRPVNPSDILWVDLNGDEKLDAAMAQNQFITFLQGEDSVQIPHEVECPSCSSGIELILTDFDDDGDKDISTVNSHGFFNLEINDFGGLESSNFDAINPNPDVQSEKFFDYDFDGDEDLLFRTGLAGYSTESIGALQRVEGGYNVYIPMLLDLQLPTLLDFQKFDVDTDGTMDLIVASTDFDIIDISWYVSDINHEWQWMNEIFSCNYASNDNMISNSNTIKPGDFNGDGLLDFSFVKPGNVYVLESSGSSNFIQVEIVGILSNDIQEQLAVADFNLDGSDDILLRTWVLSSDIDYLKMIKHNGASYSIVNLDNADLIADAVAEDFDLDGDVDIVYSKGSWISNQWMTSMYMKMNNNGANFSSPIQLVLEVQDQITDIEATDIDHDNMPDLIYATHNGQFWESSVFTSINLLDSPYQIHFHTFIDDNGNGVMDTGEVGIANRQIALEENLGYVYTNEDGEFLYYGLPGEVTSSISENASLWNETSPWSQTVLLDDINPEADIYFAMQPNGIQPIVDGVLIVDDVCNGNYSHWISIVNNGNTIADGVVTYAIDPLYSFTVANPAPDVVSGNSLTWNYTDLYYGEIRTIEVGTIAPGTASIGQTATQHLVVDVVDMSGVIATASIDHSHIIACAFDPNSIEETIGVTDAGYILADGILEYTVHFQNLGNAPATNVHVEDALGDKFDLSTLEPVASSHSFGLVISENGVAKFSFEEINLPDSESDFDGSSGFVTFRIKPIAGLPIWTILNNKAEIFFDLNPGIETNTEINTIYDCSDLEQSIISDLVVCIGDIITCSNDAVWTANLTWSFNGQQVGFNDYNHEVMENGILTMHAQNSLCDFTQDFEIGALSTNAGFTSTQNLLTANNGTAYNWYLNGNIIEGANSQFYEITESGNYSVEMINELGCAGISDQQFVTLVGVNEMVSSTLSLFPNPATNSFQLNIPDKYIGSEIFILDSQGKTVMNIGKTKSRTLSIDCAKLTNDNYHLRIGTEIVSLVIKH